MNLIEKAYQSGKDEIDALELRWITRGHDRVHDAGGYCGSLLPIHDLTVTLTGRSFASTQFGHLEPRMLQENSGLKHELNQPACAFHKHTYVFQMFEELLANCARGAKNADFVLLC